MKCSKTKQYTVYNRQYTCTRYMNAVGSVVYSWCLATLYSQLDKHITFKNIQNATSLSKNTKEGTVCQQNCLKLAGIQQ